MGNTQPFKTDFLIKQFTLDGTAHSFVRFVHLFLYPSGRGKGKTGNMLAFSISNFGLKSGSVLCSLFPSDCLDVFDPRWQSTLSYSGECLGGRAFSVW